MTETQHYKLKKPGGSDYARIETINENADAIDAAIYGLETGKADLVGGKVPLDQLPDGVPTGDIDCGTFEDETLVTLHNSSPSAHAAMVIDGNLTQAEDTSQTLEEHMNNPLAHQNLDIDGNGT